MADVVSAVRTYILAQSSVSDVISQRMYLDVLKQNATMPAATISKTSSQDDPLLSGRSGLVTTRLQVECYSTRRLEANSLAEAIYRCGIVGVKGLTHSVNIRDVQVEDGQRNYVIFDSEGGDDHRYVTQFDFLVSYLEQ